MHQRSDAELNRIAFIISKLVNLDICIASMKWQKRHNEMVKSSVFGGFVHKMTVTGLSRDPHPVMELTAFFQKGFHGS